MTSFLRYKQQLRIVQDADDIESWITVRGNHIPIKKGQSKEEAVKSFLESKGGSSSAKGLSQKNELSVNYHKDKGHIKEGNPPEGWTKVEGGTTAPNGYSWYSNNKSIFSGEREYYLYKDAEPETEKQGTKKIIEFAEEKDNDWQQSGGDYIFNELDDGKVINMEYKNDTKSPYAVRLTDVNGEKTYETQNFKTLEEAVNYTKGIEEKHNKNYYEEFSLNLYDKYHDVQRTITIKGKDIYEAKANARKEIEKLKDWDDDYFSYELAHEKVYKKNGDVETIQKIKL